MKQLTEITNLELLEILRILTHDPNLEINEIKIFENSESKIIQWKNFSIKFWLDKFHLEEMNYVQRISPIRSLEIGIYLMQNGYEIKIENWRNTNKVEDKKEDKVEMIINDKIYPVHLSYDDFIKNLLAHMKNKSTNK